MGITSVENLTVLLNKNKRYDLFVEIGGKYGRSAQFLLDRYKINKYVIIDPYVAYDKYKQDDFYKILIEKSDLIYQDMIEKFKDYPVTIIRDYSHNVVNNFENNSIDFIFVDGNHTAEYVYQDIKDYWPKVKIGGILGGDDFYMREKKIGGQYDIKMVYEGVTQYFKEEDLILFGEHRGFPFSWAKIKSI